MNAIKGFLFTAFLALAMTLEQMAMAAEAPLVPGQALTVVCNAGIPVLAPPSPPFAPPVPCDRADPPIGMTDKLIGGTHRYALSGRSTTVLRFFSGQDIDSLEIDWQPAPGSNATAVAVSIARCPGDFDIHYLPRQCFSGSSRGHLTMTAFDALANECQLTNLAAYYVNLSAINILTGQPSCDIGNPCEIDFTMTIRRLEDE